MLADGQSPWKIVVSGLVAAGAVGWAGFTVLGGKRVRVPFAEERGPGDGGDGGASRQRRAEPGSAPGIPAAAPSTEATERRAGTPQGQTAAESHLTAKQPSRGVDWPAADSPNAIGSMMDRLEQIVIERSRGIAGSQASAEALGKAVRWSVEPYALDDAAKKEEARIQLGEPPPQPPKEGATPRPPMMNLVKGASADVEGTSVKSTTLGEAMGYGPGGGPAPGNRRATKGGMFGAGDEDRFGARIKMLKAPKDQAPMDLTQRTVSVTVPMRTPKAKDAQADMQLVLRFLPDGKGGWKSLDTEIGAADPGLFRDLMGGKR